MPVLEKAQRRASEKNLETVIDNIKAQGLVGTGQTLGLGPPGLGSGGVSRLYVRTRGGAWRHFGSCLLAVVDVFLC
jgi:hypothetical protein